MPSELPTGAGSYVPPPPAPGVTDHVRAALAALVGYVSGRAQLVGLEAKEALGHYFKLAICVVLAVVLLGAGYLLGCVGLVFVIAQATHWAWEWVLLGMASAHLLVALLCLLAGWQFLRRSVFSDTLAEFKKDQEWLKTRTNKL